MTETAQDAVAVGVLQSLSAGLYLLGFGMTHGLFTVGFVAGSSLAILGAIAYLASPNHEVYRKVRLCRQIHARLTYNSDHRLLTT